VIQIPPAFEVAKKIGIPLDEWADRRHDVLQGMLEQGVVAGRIVQGYCWIRMHKGSSVQGKWRYLWGEYFRHLWIETNDGRAVDHSSGL